MSSIQGIRITFTGGTEEEISEITDAIMYVLLERGLPVSGMKFWDDEAPPEEGLAGGCCSRYESYS